jgi:hypothetical protein
LLAKLAYGIEGISLEEYLTLFHLYYDLTEITETNFLAKHSKFLEKSFELLKLLQEVTSFPVILKQGQDQALVKLLGQNLPTKREYFGLAGQRDLRKSFKLVLNDTIVPRKLPPKRFLGVGYKDKGTCRKLAEDGSPGWQSIATYFQNLEREEELDQQSSISPEIELNGP